MNKNKQNRSADSLSRLYTVVIGVALSMAVRTAVDVKGGLASIDAVTILLFISFISTIIPFYHGALRHIDDVYLDNESQQAKTSAIIIDFFLLIFHGIAFVVLSLLIKSPNQFIFIIIFVLLIDVIWGIFAYYSNSYANAHGAEGKWALINLVFVVLSSLYVYCSGLDFLSEHYSRHLPALISGACFLRSVADYYICRTFYFPK